jgi:hypothetical protein
VTTPTRNGGPDAVGAVDFWVWGPASWDPWLGAAPPDGAGWAATAGEAFWLPES